MRLLKTSSGEVDRVIVALLALMGLVVVLIGVFIYFWAIDDNPPITMTAPPVVAFDTNHLDLALDFCKLTEADAEIRMSLSNGVVYQLPTLLPPYAPPGCYQRGLQIPIPDDVSPGVYRLHITFVYQVNPVARRIVDTYSNEFEVKQR